MILVDTAPLVALFDGKDHRHGYCIQVLHELDEDLVTTTPVLTEAFHLLRPTTHRVSGLMDFVRQGGVGVLPLDDERLRRCFDLMLQYADMPMDFADASIVSAAEHFGTERVFTLDRKDFTTYRIRRGYHQIPFTIIGHPSGPRLARAGMAEEEAAVSLAGTPDPPVSNGLQMPPEAMLDLAHRAADVLVRRHGSLARGGCLGRRVSRGAQRTAHEGSA